MFRGLKRKRERGNGKRAMSQRAIGERESGRNGHDGNGGKGNVPEYKSAMCGNYARDQGAAEKCVRKRVRTMCRRAMCKEAKERQVNIG